MPCTSGVQMTCMQSLIGCVAVRLQCLDSLVEQLHCLDAKHATCNVINIRICWVFPTSPACHEWHACTCPAAYAALTFSAVIVFTTKSLGDANRSCTIYAGWVQGHQAPDWCALLHDRHIQLEALHSALASASAVLLITVALDDLSVRRGCLQ